jgi:hypothetical protein
MTDRNQRLDKLLSEAAPEIQAHWEQCREAGLSGHTQDASDKVDGQILAYVARLKALPDPAEESDVLDAMRQLYEALDAINDETDGGLLETDERELLVPLFIEAAEACGVDPEDHDGEPGGEWRNF